MGGGVGTGTGATTADTAPGDIVDLIRQELGSAPWQHHFGWRCRKMDRHHDNPRHPVPCPDCYSTESLTRKVAFVKGSQQGFTVEGEPVDVVDQRLLADALAVIEEQRATIAVNGTPGPVSDADLTPTEYLVLDVLSARRRLGENLWTFQRNTLRTLRSLEAKGYIGFKESGPAGYPQAWFNTRRPDLTGPWTEHVIGYRPIQPDDGNVLDTLHTEYGMPYESDVADRLRYLLALPDDTRRGAT